MEKVAITGRGLITPLGNGLKINEEALRQGRSGITFQENWKNMGLDSLVAGIADEDPECPLLDMKRKRFTSPNSKMAVAAAWQAIQEAGLSIEDLRKSKVALVMGCAGSAYEEIYHNAKLFYESKRVKKVTPFVVPRVMASSAVSNLSLIFGITGESYDISSACTSSAHSVLLASRLIASGMYDIVLTGGTEELNWVHALGFNAIRALSTKFNSEPARASRPFDRDRDGFVISEGAGIMVLESETHARKRGVSPKSIISGFAANSNASDMVLPSAKSSADVMAEAIKNAGITTDDVDYVNTHGTGTPAGDPVELDSIKMLFNGRRVALNSTKSMTGHMIGATGAVEIIYCSMMIEKNFICPSINVENIPDEFKWADIVRENRENQHIKHAISNSFGFGGANACIVVSSCQN